MRSFSTTCEPCRHGISPVQATLHGTDFDGKPQKESIWLIDCLKCRQELEAASGANLEQCPDCGEGELVVYDESFRQCKSCGHGFSPEQLARLANEPQHAQDNREIRECWNDQVRRGNRKGGSGDKGPKKEDKLTSRSLRQMNWSEDEATKVTRQESLEPKDAWLSVRGLPEGVSSDFVREAIERKLGL